MRIRHKPKKHNASPRTALDLLFSPGFKNTPLISASAPSTAPANLHRSNSTRPFRSNGPPQAGRKIRFGQKVEYYVSSMIAREAITSRPLLLTGVARATKHAGRTTLFLNISHAQTQKIREKLADLTQFLRKLQSAPQLTAIERWCRTLGRALVKFFQGRDPKPPPNCLPAH